jgi:hypothetical protein
MRHRRVGQSRQDPLEQTGFGFDHAHLVGIRQCHVEQPFIRTQQHRRRMRTWRNGIFRLKQWDPASDGSLLQIEFGYARSIPQTAPGAPPVVRRHYCVRKRRRNQIVRTYIELLEHRPLAESIRTTLSERLFATSNLSGAFSARDYRKACGIRQDRSFVCFLDALRHALSCGNLLRRNLYKAIPTDLAFMKAINCDPISRIARLLSSGVSNRTNRSIKVLTIGAEG